MRSRTVSDTSIHSVCGRMKQYRSMRNQSKHVHAHVNTRLCLHVTLALSYDFSRSHHHTRGSKGNGVLDTCHTCEPRRMRWVELPLPVTAHTRPSEGRARHSITSDCSWLERTTRTTTTTWNESGLCIRVFGQLGRCWRDGKRGFGQHVRLSVNVRNKQRWEGTARTPPHTPRSSDRR